MPMPAAMPSSAMTPPHTSAGADRMCTKLQRAALPALATLQRAAVRAIGGRLERFLAGGLRLAGARPLWGARRGAPREEEALRCGAPRRAGGLLLCERAGTPRPPYGSITSVTKLTVAPVVNTITREPSTIHRGSAWGMGRPGAGECAPRAGGRREVRSRRERPSRI